MNNLTRKSKFLSLILRHKPETINITLDGNGWANIEDIIKNSNGNFSKELILKISETDDKGRYELNNDLTKIRAVQGHSIEVDVELVIKEPPRFLYHGTAKINLYSIKLSGILPMTRKYVHLHSNYEIAKEVGGRHGSPVILAIYSKRMAGDGYEFLQAKNGVWLTKLVPRAYLNEITPERRYNT